MDLIQRIKFFRPEDASHFVERKDLIEKFSRLDEYRLVLVSAGPGFGKSLTTSKILEKLSLDFSWLSLSPDDNLFSRFIQYVVRSIQTRAPSFGEELLILLNLPEPPSPKKIAVLLQNELLGLTKDLMLVLDDFHYISDPLINELINSLIEYPIPFFKMVIITRRDPDLDLKKWRGKNLLLDIRSKDLRMNELDLTALYSQFYQEQPSEEQIDLILKKTEGWVLLLKLLFQRSDHPEALKSELSENRKGPIPIVHELMTEFLRKNSMEQAEQLIQLSFVNEFNKDTFCELCLADEMKSDCDMIFEKFIDHLKMFGVVIMQSDKTSGWFRFHHLFLDFLREKHTEYFTDESINSTHFKLAIWYHKNERHHEAIDHYLQCGELSKALSCFSNFRIRLLAESRYEDLRQTFELFDQENIESNLELQLTKAWLMFHSGNLGDMNAFLEPFIETLKEKDLLTDREKLLKGEIHALLSYSQYMVLGNIDSSLMHSQTSIQLLNTNNASALGLAWIFYGSSMRALGHGEQAKMELLLKLRESDNAIFKGYLLIVLYFIHWFDCELDNSLMYAKNLLEAGRIKNSKFLQTMGHTFAGIIYYNQGKNDEALMHLESSYQYRYYANLRHVLVGGLAFMHLKTMRRKVNEANEIMEEFERISLNKGDQMFIKFVDSAKALNHIRLNQGASFHWAKQNDFTDYLPESSLYSPELTQAIILTLSDEPSAWNLAMDICEMMEGFYTGRRNNNGRVRTLAIKSVLYFKMDMREKSFDLLEKVLHIAEIGDYTRPFLLLKESMEDLLESYVPQRDSAFALRVLNLIKLESEFRRPAKLSPREKEILELSRKMSNIEVGEALFISEKTVKVHITNINKKLKTSNKKDAITKATALGLLN